MTAILRHTTTSNAREEFQESPTSSSESEDDSFVRENNVPKKDDILNLDDKGINSSFERKKLLGVLLFAVMLGLVLIFLCTSQFFQLSFFFQQDSSDPISSIIHFDDPIEKFPKQATDSMNATLFPFLEIDEAIQKAHNQLYVSGFCIGIQYEYTVIDYIFEFFIRETFNSVRLPRCISNCRFYQVSSSHIRLRRRRLCHFP